MKRHLLILVFFAATFIKVYGQCSSVPSPCNSPACLTNTNTVAVTVNAGQTLYITSNHSSGAINMNGGNLVILSGNTVSANINNGGSGGTIDICGSLSGPRSFNNTFTVNNYSNSLSLSVSGSLTFNNYGTSANLTFGNATVNNYGANSTITTTANSTVQNYATGSTFSMAHDNGFSFTNNSTGATLNITGNPNSAITVNNTGSTSTLTVSSSPDIRSGSTFNNQGTLTYTSSFGQFKNGAQINNAMGATFDATNTTSASGMALNVFNRGTMTVKANGLTTSGTGLITNWGTLNFTSGTFTFNSGNTTHNYGTMSVYDFYNNATVVHMHANSLFNITHAISTVNNSFDSDGCAVIDISGSGTLEYSGGNNNLTADPDINLCGKVPYKNQDANSVTSASNGNPMTVTMATNTNNRVVNGEKVYIIGAAGNTAINGFWTVANYNAATKTFELVGSNGTTAGTYTGGATVYPVDYMGAASYYGYYNCLNPCPALPVKFLYFNATKDDHKVRLNWGTTEEENNALFIIQRSTDGVNYSNILTIEGAQDSRSSLEYVDYDLSPALGTSYYRVKQVDFDGKSSYSNVAVVKFSAAENWTIYPNPSTGSFTLSSSFDETEENIQISVIDITGRLIRYYSPSEYSPKIDINDLAKGMYLVNVSSSNGTTSKKVIVQ